MSINFFMRLPCTIDPSYYEDLILNESAIDYERYNNDDFFDDADQVVEDNFSETSEETNVIRKDRKKNIKISDIVLWVYDVGGAVYEYGYKKSIVLKCFLILKKML